MADPIAVKRALRALAADARRPVDGGSADGIEDSADGIEDSADGIVDRAATAVGDVERAAAFADRHGTEPLAAAIRDAERRGDRERARRGQRALAAFEWFRRAAWVAERRRNPFKREGPTPRQ